ncbi:MAG TPA: zf-HC2 domain-containing protein [Longimicrobiales bacterium]|nr:zf-HC2 domain-containing protein [Longimicrobiales bacterium]
MSDRYHPTEDRLEAFVEGLLDAGERVVIESHLVGCPRCGAQVEEWRALFAALSGLPQFEPAPGFAERVMSGVRVAPKAKRRPSWQRARGWAAGRAATVGTAVAGVLPKSTFGWAVAAAFLALPVLAGAAFTAWLLSRSYLTPETLWAYVSSRAVEGVQSLGSTALTAALQTDVIAWLVLRGGELLETAGATGVGAVLATVSAATMLSIWVLYRNLIRTPTRETNYVTFSF